MRNPPALLALLLASLPATAFAQRAARIAPTRSVDTASVSASVSLTQHGTHARFESTLARGLEVLDRQDVDVDGDGDTDALVLLDARASDDDNDGAPKPNLGRGIALVFHERHGWRAQTVGSVPLVPVEAGYNWGRVESLRAGANPLLHVMYSAMVEDVVHQRDTVLQFANGSLREVFSSSIESAAGGGDDDGALTRALSVQAADVDHDGTSELLERVATSAHCPESGCFGPDGMLAPTVARRAFRWDSARGAFVEATTLAGYEAEATHALDESVTRWQAGDLAARDASITRAYAVDPLNPRVRIAYARLLLRAHEYTHALDALDFAWPEGFGRDAQALKNEAIAHSG